MVAEEFAGILPLVLGSQVFAVPVGCLPLLAKVDVAGAVAENVGVSGLAAAACAELDASACR